MAIDRTTAFVASARLYPRHFQIALPPL